MASDRGVVRLERDPGLLTNQRMSLEVGVGLAHLTGRRLSMPWSVPIAPAPGPRPAGTTDPVAPGLLDLWDVPVDIVPDEEWADHDDVGVGALDWGPYNRCVYLGHRDPVPTPELREFAHGRTRFVRVPDDDRSAYAISGRPLCFASWFFHATGDVRRGLFAAWRGVRLRDPYVDLAEQVASDLGRFNVAHVRRTDLVQGIRAYAGVSPVQIAATLADVVPDDEQLVVTTEADPASALFDPIRARFPRVEFLSAVILGDHGGRFRDLPFSEDNALGAVAQEVAVRAGRFVGTMGSTFTALIHRRRREIDPEAPFLYTADVTPSGPSFEHGEYREVHEGRYTWNRIRLAIDPGNLGWQREWPEAVSSPDDAGPAAADPADVRRPDDDLPIHTVVCTDTNPYGDWQCRFQEHTWRRVRQPGELVRLLAVPEGGRVPHTVHARVVTTSARNDHPDAPVDYAGFNRLWSFREWLERERPTGTVVVLDSDMVFRAPIRTVARPGEIVAQEWHGLTVEGVARHLDGVGSPTRPYEPFTWPMLIDCGDLAAIIDRWIELTAVLRRDTGMWESDMFALVATIAESDLDVRYETLGAWMNWPEEFVAGAPTIHYCQRVIDTAGNDLWYKQDYRPWSPLGFDPNRAALDYCRDLMHLLDEYIGIRSREG